MRNPGFENGVDGFNIPDGLAAPDTATFKGGAGSLKLSNPDPKNYKWVAQTISTTGGATYRFAAQVKGENVVSLPDAGSNQGAGIFMEWYDAAGNWLGGAYPDSKKGAFDWTRMEGTAKLPLGARKLILGLYLRQGSSGTAWFDDLEVVATTPVLRSFVTAPGYHGLIMRGDASPWSAQLSVDRAPDLAAPLRVRSQVLVGGKVVGEQLTPVPVRKDGEPESVQFTVSQVPVSAAVKSGAQPTWKIEVLDAAGRSVAQQEVALRVADKAPRVSIDKGGAWRVAGQPFFPLGIYCEGEGDASDASLTLIHDAGFNTVLNYSYSAGKDPVAFLDHAQKHGLKVIYSLKDFTRDSYLFPKGKGTPAQLIAQYVNLVKSHPALLGWYLNDEGGLEHEADYRAMQQQVLALDSDHPIIHVLNQYGDLDGYYDLTDVLGVDPYPIPRFNFDIVSTWTGNARAAARGAKSTLLASQEFSWDAYANPFPGYRMPTTDEMRTMNLLGLCEKTNGILFYAFMDLYLASDGKRDYSRPDMAKFARDWPKVTVVSHELQSLLPTLLAGQDATLDAQNSNPTQLKFRALRDGQTMRLIVANADAKNAATLLLTRPHFAKATLQTGALTITPQSDGWKIEAAPHASGVIVLR